LTPLIDDFDHGFDIYFAPLQGIKNLTQDMMDCPISNDKNKVLLLA
jgi:hypothetical protein